MDQSVQMILQVLCKLRTQNKVVNEPISTDDMVRSSLQVKKKTQEKVINGRISTDDMVRSSLQVKNTRQGSQWTNQYR